MLFIECTSRLMFCPRIHPEKPKLLVPSTTDFDEKPASKIAEFTLHVLSAVGLTQITYGPATKQSNGGAPKLAKRRRIVSSTNLTLPNVLLYAFGPMSEPALVRTVLGIQVLGTVFAFGLRYGLAGLVYDGDRR
jgi:UDP-N-acetylglucosamine--dolichyl-phosphate N-acetylglucosaminephosphotransferase